MNAVKPLYLSLVLALAGQAPGALVVHYSFDNESVGPVSNGATFENWGSTTIFGQAQVTPDGSIQILEDSSPAGGNHVRMVRLGGMGRNQATLINTGISFTDLGLNYQSSWTMMAWIRFEPAQFDNFAFSQVTLQPGVLHYGARVHNGLVRYYSGHWNDDWVSSPASVELNAWHHVTWTNDSSGTQQIFVDGQRIDLELERDRGPEFDLTSNISIGGPNGFMAFQGGIDDVRIYDELLDANTIASLARPIPEPSSTTFLMLLGAACLGTRRRDTAAR